MLPVRARSGAAALCVTVLCVAAGRAAALPQLPQQQQQQQLAGLPSGVADQVLHLLAQAVRQELKPVVDRLQSRLEAFDSRLTLLDTRVGELTLHLLRGYSPSGPPGQAEPSGRSEGQSSPLNDTLTARLDEISSRQEDTAATVDQMVSRIDSLAARLETLESRLSDSRLPPQVAQSTRPDEAANTTTSRPTDARQPTAKAQIRARDCSDLPPGSPSGTYLLRPSRNDSQPPVQSRCDMDTDGGGWTVIQRRAYAAPEQEFDLGWAEYRLGFGDVTGELWWGLDNIWQLTSSPERQYELRVDLESFDGERAHAIYSEFGVASEREEYRLLGGDTFREGTAGHSLQYHIDGTFKTNDRNDGSICSGQSIQTGRIVSVPWWYNRHGCGGGSLNGQRRHSPIPNDASGIVWYPWKKSESLKGTRMMIRPVHD